MEDQSIGEDGWVWTGNQEFVEVTISFDLVSSSSQKMLNSSLKQVAAEVEAREELQSGWKKVENKMS